MSVGGLATLDIEWIDLIYNTSHEAPGASCKSVCKVDNIANNPVPQVGSGNVRTIRIGMVLVVVLGGDLGSSTFLEICAGRFTYRMKRMPFMHFPSLHPCTKYMCSLSNDLLLPLSSCYPTEAPAN